MIIRLVTYHALDGKDVERWMQTSALELRGVEGMRHVEFIRSKTNPSQYLSLIHISEPTRLLRRSRMPSSA